MTPKRFLLVIIVIVALLAAGGAAYYTMSRDTFSGGSVNVADDEGLTDEDVANFVDAVSEHIILPQDEEPVAAKIVDIDELLKTQPFYRGAINGDILLIYQAAAKAILYSPSRDILVNVGPIVVDEEAPVDAQTGTDTSGGVPLEETQ